MAGGSLKASLLRILAFPVLINGVIAIACFTSLGTILGWQSPERASMPIWLGNGLPFVQFLTLAYLLDRLIHWLASGTALPRLGVQLVSVVIYFSALAFAVSLVLGESLGTLLAASGIVGLAIGFAVRGLLADLFSGIVLHLDSHLSPGDWIDMNHRGREISGKLIDIQWRAVVIADRMENLVLIPNSEFTTTHVINRSRPTSATEYGAALPIGSEYDRARITQILETALARVVADGTILSKPGPYVRVGGLDNGLITYRMFYCVDPSKTAPPRAQSAVLGTSMDFLKSAGISLYPVRRTQYRRQLAPGHDRGTETEVRLGALANVPLLEVLSQSELQTLAEHAQLRRFAAGRTILRQGEDGDSMMVVVQGRLKVSIPDEQGGFRDVATIWPGECIGEMSLLTGEPRSATVTAQDAVTLYEVDKAALAPILQANPSQVDHLAAIIQRRRASGQDNSHAANAEQTTDAAKSLIGKIKKFFVL